MEVENYNLFSNDNKQKIKEFCDKYDLPEPTFFAGITGEFE